MKIYIACDHHGVKLKGEVIDYLKSAGYDVESKGDDKFAPDDDFPIFAAMVVNEMLSSNDPDPRGILICNSGQGMCMAANRFKGIRACLAWDVEAARAARNDEDSNVLCLPARAVNIDQAHAILDIWLKTPFAAAARFIRRNHEMDE